MWGTPGYRGVHKDRFYCTANMSLRDTMWRGHPLNSKTCHQGKLCGEDTLNTVKPGIKGHYVERSSSQQ